MRLKKRIDPFLEKIDLEKLLKRWFPNWEPSTLNVVVNEFGIRKEELTTFWKNEYDLRFSQLLINYNLIPNVPGFWYMDEEDEILIAQGHTPADVMYWGRNFDKNMVRLERTEWILIKDMTTDHIQAVLDGKYTKHTVYLKAFNDELAKRKDDK